MAASVGSLSEFALVTARPHAGEDGSAGWLSRPVVCADEVSGEFFLCMIPAEVIFEGAIRGECRLADRTVDGWFECHY